MRVPRYRNPLLTGVDTELKVILKQASKFKYSGELTFPLTGSWFAKANECIDESQSYTLPTNNIKKQKQTKHTSRLFPVYLIL